MSKEIVLIAGMQGAGKSTVVDELVQQDYFRYNRDEYGISIEKLHGMVSHDIKYGMTGRVALGKPAHEWITKAVLDNTYPTIESRKEIIKIAKSNGFKIRIINMATPFEDCQFNVCTRMIKKHGYLPQPAEVAILGAKDPAFIPPVVQYKYKKDFQKPTIDEGFDAIENRPFVRKFDPTYTNKALILDYDGCLRETISGHKYPKKPKDIRILPGRTEKIKQYLKDGYYLLGVSNQSGVGKGDLDHGDCIACFKRTNEMLGLDIDYAFCPHKVPPIICYCRKPGPGLGVQFIEKYKLDPRQCLFVGDMTSDKTFAARCGFKFQHSDLFFKNA